MRSVQNEPNTLESYFIAEFGTRIAKDFLIPYNSKLYGTTLDGFSIDVINRFFPKPDEDIILGNKRPVSYNSQFWYPKKDGIQALVNALDSSVDWTRADRLCDEVLGLDRVDGMWHVDLKSGARLVSNEVISSLPLDEVARMLRKSNILSEKSEAFLDKAAISSTFAINFKIEKSKVSKVLLDNHWIYVVDNVSFHRVGNYSNFLDLDVHDSVSCYVEVGVYNNELPNVHVVFTELRSLGLITEEPTIYHTSLLKNGYVQFLDGMTESRDKLLSELQTLGFYSIGRYGLWDYISMEDSINTGYELASKIQ